MPNEMLRMSWKTFPSGSGVRIEIPSMRRPDALISALIGFAIGKIAGTTKPRFGRLAWNFPLGSYSRQ